MNELVAEISVGGSPFSDSASAHSGDPYSGQLGMRKLDLVRVPSALRGDEVLAPLIDQYHNDRSRFRSQYQELRNELAVAAEGDKAAITGKLRRLMRSNQLAQSDFRRSMRERMRALRLTTSE